MPFNQKAMFGQTSISTFFSNINCKIPIATLAAYVFVYRYLSKKERKMYTWGDTKNVLSKFKQNISLIDTVATDEAFLEKDNSWIFQKSMNESVLHSYALSI